MASTYSNSGIELITTGEQSGTWGDTTNTNLQIIDRLVNGVGDITLSGTTHTLTTSDGSLSDGHFRVLVFGGTPSGTNTVTITPNDVEHLYFVQNNSGQSVILTQGTGGNITIANGASAIVYCDGAGSGAEVVELSAGFDPEDYLPLSGGTMTGDLNFGDNIKSVYGVGSDLQIYHTGTASVIHDNGVGNLVLRTDGLYINNAAGTENMVHAAQDGAVTLYHNNSAKLATSSTGADITGTNNGETNLNISNTNTGSDAQVRTKYTTDGGLFTVGKTSDAHAYGGDAYVHNVDNTNIRFATNDTERLRITSGGKLDIKDNGTAAAPSVIFQGDSDTGFYRPTANTWALATAGTERVRFDSSGTLLMGRTSTPPTAGAKIAVGSTGDTAVQITKDGVVAGRVMAVTTGLAFGVDGSDGATERMRIDSNGNVGIGVSSIVNPGGSRRGLQLSNSTNGGILFLNNNASEDQNPRVFGDITNTTDLGFAAGGTNGTISYYTNNTERMRLDSSGNLFVGKTGFANNTAGHQIEASGLLRSVRANSEPALFNRTSSDGDIVVIKKDDSLVGSIGSASGQLEVKSAGSNLNVFIQGSRTVRFDGYRFYPETTNAYDIGYSTQRFKDGLFTGTIYAANFDSTSDATLKTNVETIPNALDKVQQLRGVSFDWIESGKSEVGVIAQEVEAVIPELVSTDDQGIKSVKYGNIVSVLIEAIKEQQAQIDELKAKLGD